MLVQPRSGGELRGMMLDRVVFQGLGWRKAVFGKAHGCGRGAR